MMSCGVAAAKSSFLCGSFQPNRFRLPISSRLYREEVGYATLDKPVSLLRVGSPSVRVWENPRLSARGRRTGRSRWLGRRFRRGGFRLGARFRIPRGLRFGAGGRLFLATRLWCAPALGRIVVHIPACALELQGRRRQRTFERAPAFGAHELRLSAEFLNLLELVTALLTPIFV